MCFEGLAGRRAESFWGRIHAGHGKASAIIKPARCDLKKLSRDISLDYKRRYWQIMVPVERVWSKLYTVGTRLFLFFTSIALLFLALALFLIKTEPNWGYTVFFAFLLNALIWLLLGIIGLIRNKVLSKKLSHLKATGKAYEVTIEEIIPGWYTRLGSYITACVQGHYIDSLGNSRFVRSPLYAFTPFDKKGDFTANVYVDPSGSRSHAFELLRKE